MRSAVNLSRRRFILRGLAGCLGFGVYFGFNDLNTLTHLTDFSAIVNKDISSYLQENCDDDLERAIIYFPKKRRIEDISIERKPDSVSFSGRKIKEALKREKHAVFAHSHIVSLSKVLDLENEEHKKAIEKYGEHILKRRLMRESPSSKHISDVAIFLELLYESISKSKNPENNNLNLGFRIVTLEKGVKPRVIGIEAKQKLMDKIRDFDYSGDFGNYMISELIGREAGIYRDVAEEYYDSHADVFEISEKPEPSFLELARLINEKTNFLIRYYGQFDVREYISDNKRRITH